MISKTPMSARASALIAALWVLQTTSPLASAEQANTLAAPSGEQATLLSFLKTQDNSTQTRYVASFVDLDGDHVDEAIVYLMGRDWCGSGGCNTLVLKQKAGSWAIVTELTLTRRPIRVLTNISHGWHDLGVWVQGGGILKGYEAVLRFDGKTYPKNPTVAPALKADAGPPPGEVVIAESADAKRIDGQ